MLCSNVETFLVAQVIMKSVKFSVKISDQLFFVAWEVSIWGAGGCRAQAREGPGCGAFGSCGSGALGVSSAGP